MEYSQLAKSIKPSPTLAITALANQLIGEGKDIIKLTAGEPDFQPPEFVIEAALQALRDGKTKYTAASGIPELKQAVVDKFSHDNGLNYIAKQVVVSTGAKQAIFHCLQSIISPGDEVLIPAPYWVSYPDMAALFGSKNIILPTSIDKGFLLDPQQLEQAITSRTRLLFLNSPSNPAGSVYSRSDLEKIAEVLLKHPQVWVLSDDIYEKIYWADQEFVNLPGVCPELLDRTCVVNGVSKAYAMTGLRLGYAAGPEPLIRLMSNIQSQSTSNPCTISQYAALAALTGDQQSLKVNNENYRAAHQLMLDLLGKIKGLTTHPGQGAFYLLPDCRQLISQLEGVSDDIDLCKILLNEVGLAVVSGSSFGCPGHIRLSYATSEDTIREGIQRLARIAQRAG